jgi:hypothetical protein
MIKMAEQGKVSTVTREKVLLDQSDTEELLRFIYCSDEFGFQHPRIRSELAFLINIFARRGIRTGEMIESSCHPFSGHGEYYGDYEVFIICEKDRGKQYYMKQRLRFRKGNRDDKGQGYVAYPSLS